MAKKNNISTETICEWLHSTGYFFPRNELEIKRFEKLHGDFKYHLEKELIEPKKIIKSLNESSIHSRKLHHKTNLDSVNSFKNWNIAARNTDKIKKSTIEQIIKNQNETK